jgi:hypothetical protein
LLKNEYGGRSIVMPIYYDVHNYVIKDYLKGVNLSPLGIIDFKNAVVEK